MRYVRLIENLAGRSSLGFGLGSGRWIQYATPTIHGYNVSSLNFLELQSIKGAVGTQSKWKLVALVNQTPIPELELLYCLLIGETDHMPLSTPELGTAWATGMISPDLKVPS